jgi:alkylated DNA repair protein (DNA oxidative demethylase)
MHGITQDLFNQQRQPSREALGDGAWLLRSFLLPEEDAQLLDAVNAIAVQAPFRHLVTPGGHTMSVAMTNCGLLGWTSDSDGYRYSRNDPGSRQPWPAMPDAFLALAGRAAAAAGYAHFRPDACLVNRYLPGTRLTLHQDRNERDLAAPIVSVSLGVAATFLFGGQARSGRVQRFRLEHGDVAVWGGVSRLTFHGIAPLKEALHPLTGQQRINLTFRKVLP